MKRIIALLLAALMLFSMAGCDPGEREVTLHLCQKPYTPLSDIISDKASEWQGKDTYIMQLTKEIDPNYTYDINYVYTDVGGKIKTTEVTVKYTPGDTILDVLSDSIYITEPCRADKEKNVDFCSILIYPTRYGIPTPPYSFATNKWLTDLSPDWNRLVVTDDIWIVLTNH